MNGYEVKQTEPFKERYEEWQSSGRGHEVDQAVGAIVHDPFDSNELQALYAGVRTKIVGNTRVQFKVNTNDDVIILLNIEDISPITPRAS